MHVALYRKWRPQTFSDVCGQEHITDVLSYEVMHDKVSHAYLFCGSRGTGKTTCAKILAKAVNCEKTENGNPCGKCSACLAVENENTTDIVEMDAASNNGVDDIRLIKDAVAYSPGEMKKRVYIIDEVHMLSQSAFNALLKTLEEPPSQVIFILATTEIQKLPATIVSRCQRFDFRRIKNDVITARLKYISEKEGFSLTDDAASLIARLARGGMRDAIGLLELCSGQSTDITLSVVLNTAGVAGYETMVKITEAVFEKDYETVFSTIASLEASSKELGVFWQELISFYRDLLVVKTTKNAVAYLDLTESEYTLLSDIAKKCSTETALYHIKLLMEANGAMQKGNTSKRITAELTLVKMCDAHLSVDSEALLSRISALEAAISTGVAISPPINIKTDTEKQKSETSIPMKKQTVSMESFSSWVDVLGEFEKGDVMTAAFLKGSKSYTDGNTLNVVVPDAFTLEMVDKPTVRASLEAIIRTQCEKSLSVEFTIKS